MALACPRRGDTGTGVGSAPITARYPAGPAYTHPFPAPARCRGTLEFKQQGAGNSITCSKNSFLLKSQNTKGFVVGGKKTHHVRHRYLWIWVLRVPRKTQGQSTAEFNAGAPRHPRKQNGSSSPPVLPAQSDAPAGCHRGREGETGFRSLMGKKSLQRRVW